MYKVIQERDIKDLEKRVTKYLKKGYTLAHSYMGSKYVVGDSPKRSGYRPTHCQVMIKPEETI